MNESVMVAMEMEVIEEVMKVEVMKEATGMRERG